MSRDLTKDHGTIVTWKKTYGFLKADGHGAGDVYFLDKADINKAHFFCKKISAQAVRGCFSECLFMQR